VLVKTVGDAYKQSQDKFSEYIKYYDTGGGSDHPHSELIVRLLKIDKRGQRQFGDESATITGAGIPLTQAAGGAFFASLGAGALINKYILE